MHVIAHPVDNGWVVECSEHGFVCLAIDAFVDAALASHSASHSEVIA